MRLDHSSPDFGFVRVAAAVPPLEVADLARNLEETLALAERADEQGAQVVVFPELGLTGYTAGDLFHQQLLLDRATEALLALVDASAQLRPLLVVGYPLAADGALFNTAAVVSGGRLRGLVPKTYIPGYKEYYEERWFASARDLALREVRLGGHQVPVGSDLLFQAGEQGVVLGVEICEDLWGPLPPSSFQVLHGAHLIANLSASNELVGKADYRRSLVAQQSARAICGYIYTSCGIGESSQDVVFGGHALVAENGVILGESQRFSRGGELVVVDVDVEHLRLDRERTTSFADSLRAVSPMAWRRVDVDLPPYVSGGPLCRPVDAAPFIPCDDYERSRRTEEIFAIQTSGLVKRMSQTGIKRLVVGLSGGLDSTLALLVAVRAFDVLQLPRDAVHALTMPGFGTTSRTRGNAERLARACGVTLEEIDITAGSLRQFQELGHDPAVQDVTYENVQARYRTMLLMNKANQLRALVLGTGDLSEIALGWNTFNGDHISHYNVNAGIPKTLVRYLVGWVAEQGQFAAVREVLQDVLGTPISPELVGDGGGVVQRTEEIIGPYELHDFFLYHFARWESRPAKILFLAERAFAGKYDTATIRKWLRVFVERFFRNQWKRSVMPDGPKVGSVALSPRGDWRMPSDAEVTLWLEDLE
jgi:NAD+ synthase (glutamine-hydrolysing)